MITQKNECPNPAFLKAGFAGSGRCPIFFTGGTALREVSRELACYTSDSVHLITTFDSGGSSAALRRAFAMPAVGDLRNRLLALADPSVPNCVLEFCFTRLPEDVAEDRLRKALLALGNPTHPRWQHMPGLFAEPLQRLMTYFLERMPAEFDPRRAALGNLLLAGGYLRHKRDFGPVLALFSRLLRLRGVVEPIVNESLHLAAELADGSFVYGQHHFRHLTQAVRRIFLSVHEPERIRDDTPIPPSEAAEIRQFPPSCRPPLAAQAASWLSSPKAIIYPMGSFYSSVLATLLPRGVGSAIAQTSCPKIFIPNSGHDPELCGISVVEQCRAIITHLRQDAPAGAPDNFLRYVLVDGIHGRYHGFDGQTKETLAAMNLELVEADIVCHDNPQRHDPKRLVQELLRLFTLPAKLKYANQTQ
jgi:CofD-related protein of GAK system